MDSTQIIEKLIIGDLGLYLTTPQLADLMDSMVKDYKNEVVYDFDIGISPENRPIKAYAFMLGTNENDFEDEL